MADAVAQQQLAEHEVSGEWRLLEVLVEARRKHQGSCRLNHAALRICQAAALALVRRLHELVDGRPGDGNVLEAWVLDQSGGTWSLALIISHTCLQISEDLS